VTCFTDNIDIDIQCWKSKIIVNVFVITCGVPVCLLEFDYLLHSDQIPTCCVNHFIFSVNRSRNFELLLISS
jgi:hypothetical protein